MAEPLPQGGTIRKLWMGETGIYREHLLRLDPDSRRSRFGGAVSDEVVGSYAEAALGLDSVVHGFFLDGTLRGAAELRLPSKRGDDAEAAFSVERPWQSYGVGSALLERTLLAARNRGVSLLHMVCLADNRRMQQLARKYEADLAFDFGSVIGELKANGPTPLSLMREMVADGHGIASALLDAQFRLLKPA